MFDVTPLERFRKLSRVTSKNTISVAKREFRLKLSKEYKAGIAAFEHGQYRESVQHLERQVP